MAARGAFGLIHSTLQVLKFLLHQEAGDGGLEELGHAFGGGVGAVGGAEGVVHVHLGQTSQLFSETGFVLLFLGKETHVFEQHHIAIGHGVHLGFSIRADAAVGLGHGLTQQFAQAGGHGGEAHGVVHLTLGTAEVSRQDHLGALADQVVDRGQGGADAGVVGDRTGLVQGHVEINPHENAFAAQVAGVKAGQGTLRHGVVSCGKKTGGD